MKKIGLAPSILLCVVAGACSLSSKDSVQSTVLRTAVHDISTGSLDPALFSDGALAKPVTTEACTLSGGTETTCYRITIAGAPSDDSPVGPWCPSSIHSTAKEGGIWFDNSGTVYDVDGEFIANLSTIYQDDRWQMYDKETGQVSVIGGAEGCEVAGDPNNSSGRDNFCLECDLPYIDGGIERTMLIPVKPVAQNSPTEIRGANIGIALNGVLFGPPAPVDLILSTITLGVFDDCGGHSNPHEGYHYHAANGCSELGIQPDGHAPMIGYALDGYAIYANTDSAGSASSALDECGGETDSIRGYHYHAQPAGTNKIIGCFMGEQGINADARSGPGGRPNGGPGGPGGPPPDKQPKG